MAQKKEVIAVRNDLDGLAYQTEKMIKENEAKFAADDVTSAKSLIEESRKLIAKHVNDSSPEEFKAVYDKLQTVTQKMSTELYKQQTSGTAADAGRGRPAGGRNPGSLAPVFSDHCYTGENQSPVSEKLHAKPVLEESDGV